MPDDASDELPEVPCDRCPGDGGVARFPDQCGAGCCTMTCPRCRGQGALDVGPAGLETAHGAPPGPLVDDESDCT